MGPLLSFVDSPIGCIAACSVVFAVTIGLFVTDGSATEQRVKEFFRK